MRHKEVVCNVLFTNNGGIDDGHVAATRKHQVFERFSACRPSIQQTDLTLHESTLHKCRENSLLTVRSRAMQNAGDAQRCPRT